jgi:hypothetical protein
VNSPQTSDEQHDGESRRERINRELIELLNELRVALPGVQVLFAFLLAVPFAQGWRTTTNFQRDLFFATLIATAISAAFLIAPTAYHRIHFRNQEKENILLVSNKFSITGLMFLGLAMVGAVTLITDFLYSTTAAMIVAAVAFGLYFGLWVGMPLSRHAKSD